MPQVRREQTHCLGQRARKYSIKECCLSLVAQWAEITKQAATTGLPFSSECMLRRKILQTVNQLLGCQLTVEEIVLQPQALFDRCDLNNNKK